MKQEIIKKTYTNRILWLLLVLGIFTQSCRVAIVPEYDAELQDDIYSMARQVDYFYLRMAEASVADSGARDFRHYVDSYIDIETGLNSLLIKNRVKPLNANSTRICEITIELWKKYKEEHRKETTLDNGTIILNRKTFSDLFYAMMVAEKGKQLSANPPK